jgi:flagellin
MGLRINTNVQALAAQRHLVSNSEGLKQSIEKMASGSRITRAADDAAGLAISETMRGTIRSVRQNLRNANDGIGLIQTAEGGLTEVANILIRFRELSIQSASDTIGDTERGFIDKEVGQLATEIQRIASSTEFNGKKILSGEEGPLEFQIGPKNNPDHDRFTFDPGKISATLGALGLDGITVANKQSAQENLGKIDDAMMALNGNRAELGAVQNRMQATINNLRVYDENLSSSESQIRDLDMANEASELVKRDILANAGTAVLSQANQNTRLALKLF